MCLCVYLHFSVCLGLDCLQEQSSLGLPDSAQHVRIGTFRLGRTRTNASLLVLPSVPLLMFLLMCFFIIHLSFWKSGSAERAVVPVLRLPCGRRTSAPLLMTACLSLSSHCAFNSLHSMWFPASRMYKKLRIYMRKRQNLIQELEKQVRKTNC